MSARDALHPDMKVAHSGVFAGAVLRHIESLLAQVYPFKNDRDMVMGDLARIDDEKIIKALKKPGISLDKREQAHHYIKQVRKFAEPLGTRFPIRPELMERYEEDGDFDNRPAVVSRGMSFSDEQILHLEKLLRQDGSELSNEMLQRHAETIEDAHKASRVTLHVNRPVIEWTEKDHGYELRTKSQYSPYSSPTINVIRRWDAIIQDVQVSIIRCARRPGVGAYYVVVNTDTNPEPIIYDRCTFLDAENALIHKLGLRPIGLEAPASSLERPL